MASRVCIFYFYFYLYFFSFHFFFFFFYNIPLFNDYYFARSFRVKFKILAITISTNILSRIKKEKIAANYAINCAEILLDFVVTVIAVAPFFFFSIIIVGVNVSDKRGNVAAIPFVDDR